jgi:CheY-like chemotaxis protein
VLVMDDDATVREMLAACLQRLGYDATFTAEGVAALAACREAIESRRPFDVALLDLTIPGGMGGTEALGLLREIDPGLRAVVSSGYSDDPVLARHGEYGFDAILPKPYSATDLQRVLGSLPPRDDPTDRGH